MTKLERVVNYLQRYQSGSKMQIRSACDYDNVGDAIMKLRMRGHNIVTRWHHSNTGARYAVYEYRGLSRR